MDFALDAAGMEEVDRLVAKIRQQSFVMDNPVPTRNFWQELILSGCINDLNVPDDRMHAWVIYKLMDGLPHAEGSSIDDPASQFLLGETPLERAIMMNLDVKIVEMFIILCPASLVFIDSKGRNVLHICATFSSNKEVCELIVNKNDEAAYEKDNEGNLPFHLAMFTMQRNDILEIIPRANLSAVGERIVWSGSDDIEVYTSSLVMAIKMNSELELINIIVSMCPLTLMFMGPDLMLPIHVALHARSPICIIEKLLSVTLLHAQASLTTANQNGKIAIALAIALRAPVPIVAAILKATMAVMAPLHRKLYGPVLSSMSKEGLYVPNPSGIDFEKVGDAFVVEYDCYFSAWQEGRETSRTLINSKNDFQICVDSTVTYVSANGQHMTDMRAADIVYKSMEAADFEVYHASILPMLLQALGTDKVMHNTFGESMLCYAVMHRLHSSAIRMLIEYSPSMLVENLDVDGNTAMHTWAANGISMMLMPPSIVGESGLERMTGKPPLFTSYAAIERNARPTIGDFRVLFEAWPEAVFVLNKSGFSFFHFLVSSNCATEVLEEVLRTVPQALYQNTSSGDSPLHVACTNMHIPHVLEKLKADFNGASAKFMDMPFVSTANKERSAIVQWLLLKNPAAASQQNTKGAIPLHYAAYFHCDSDVVRHLLKEYPEGLSVPDCESNLPLHLALDWNGAQFASRAAVLKQMIKLQPDMTIRNAHGWGFLRSSLPTTYAVGSQEKQLNLYHPETIMSTDSIRVMRKALFFDLLHAHVGALHEIDKNGRTPLQHFCHLLTECMDSPFIGTFVLHFQVMCNCLVYLLSDLKEAAEDDIDYIRKVVINTLAVRDSARAATGEPQTRAAGSLNRIAWSLQKTINILQKGVDAKVFESRREEMETLAKASEKELTDQIEAEEAAALAGAGPCKNTARKRKDKERKMHLKQKAQEEQRIVAETEQKARRALIQQQNDEIIRKKNKKHNTKRAKDTDVSRKEWHRETNHLFLDTDAFQRTSDVMGTKTGAVGLATAASSPEEAQGAVSPQEAQGAASPQEAQGAASPQEAPGAVSPQEAQGAPSPQEAMGAKTGAVGLAMGALSLEEAMGSQAGAVDLQAAGAVDQAWSGDGAPAAWGTGERRMMAMQHAAELNSIRLAHELQRGLDLLARDNMDECVICMDSKKCMAMVPCGHIALCAACAGASLYCYDITVLMYSILICCVQIRGCFPR